jgi:hypothetical protein
MLAANQAVDLGGREMAIGLWISFAEGTQEQYDAVNAEMGAEERLGPAIAALGDQAPPNPPKIKEFEVYNTIGG